jgi:hypothetical protein
MPWKGRARRTAPCEALMSAIAGGSIISGNVPFEPVKFNLKNNQVSGLIHHSLEADWGYRAAQALFSNKNIIHTGDFHLVWWDGLSAAKAMLRKGRARRTAPCNALMSAIAGGSIISGNVPFKQVKFNLKNNRVSGSIHHSLEADWGYRTAQTLFSDKNNTDGGL